MTLTGLNTFVAGTKAKASEVNENFSLVKSFVDVLEGDVATNTSDISNLENNKADVNGNASNRFAVADAVNNTDAMNKESVFTYTANSQRYINGLRIMQTASDTISIQAGSAMDSTFTKVMVLGASASLQNITQAINSTYYIYLIAKEDGTTQCIYSSDSVTPTLPTGYVYYRQIGKYFTRTLENKISMVLNIDEYIGKKYDYANATGYNTTYGNQYYFGNTFTAECDGLLVICGRFTMNIIIDGVTVVGWYFGDQGFTGSITAPVSRGQTYTFSGSNGSISWAKFVPIVKYTIS